jgi:hypothetical protein
LQGNNIGNEGAEALATGNFVPLTSMILRTDDIINDVIIEMDILP